MDLEQRINQLEIEVKNLKDIISSLIKHEFSEQEFHTLKYEAYRLSEHEQWAQRNYDSD